MSEWIAFEEKWPPSELTVNVRFGSRVELAKRYGKTVCFTDQEKMRKSPPTEEVTHWKPGRWL